MLEVVCNDRLGRKTGVKCLGEDTVGELKLVLGAQIGMDPARIVLKRGYLVLKDHISLHDYEIGNGTGVELYYS